MRYQPTILEVSLTKFAYPADPDEGVFIQQNEQGDIVVEDVTHLRKDMTGKGEVAKGGGKVTLALAIDMTDVSIFQWHSYK